jgi:hypothetical protein
MSSAIISLRNGASRQVQCLKIYNVPRQNLVNKLEMVIEAEFDLEN